MASIEVETAVSELLAEVIHCVEDKLGENSENLVGHHSETSETIQSDVPKTGGTEIKHGRETEGCHNLEKSEILEHRNRQIENGIQKERQIDLRSGHQENEKSEILETEDEERSVLGSINATKFENEKGEFSSYMYFWGKTS
jgi:hypothetical protein